MRTIIAAILIATTLPATAAPVVVDESFTCQDGVVEMQKMLIARSHGYTYAKQREKYPKGSKLGPLLDAAYQLDYSFTSEMGRRMVADKLFTLCAKAEESQ